MRKDGDGYTGGSFEYELFGYCGVSWQDTGYLSYEESMKIVKSSQPWNPMDPKCRLANNFHYAVTQALGLEDCSELKFYTAVGSALDRYHGIDCLFEFHGIVVTIDVTINRYKNNCRADVLVNFNSGINEEGSYLDVIRQASREVADCLLVGGR